MNKLVPKRRLRKFPKVSSLPSFVIHGVEETNKQIQEVFPLKTCPELSEIDIGTPPGSPYCRRVPISERERPRYKSKYVEIITINSQYCFIIEAILIQVNGHPFH